MPSVNLITALPNFVSPDEHRALVGSTPTSFNDIPPVLRYKEENVSVSLDPPLDGFTGPDSAQGTLYVITRYSNLVIICLLLIEHTKCPCIHVQRRTWLPD